MAAVGQSGPTPPGARMFDGAFREVLLLAGRLVRDEASLAGTEIAQSGRRLLIAVAMIVCGVALLIAGIIALVVAGVAALTLIWPLWQAAASVAIGVLVLGGAICGIGYLLARRAAVIPERTRRSLAATLEWMKQRVD